MIPTEGELLLLLLLPVPLYERPSPVRRPAGSRLCNSFCSPERLLQPILTSEGDLLSSLSDSKLTESTPKRAVCDRFAKTAAESSCQGDSCAAAAAEAEGRDDTPSVMRGGGRAIEGMQEISTATSSAGTVCTVESGSKNPQREEELPTMVVEATPPVFPVVDDW
jgi:hypothetical protein